MQGLPTIKALLLCLTLSALASAVEPELPAIETVKVGQHRELLVNGEPFFPIMSWAQSQQRFSLLKSLGFNTFCGSGGGSRQVLEAAQNVGGYAIVSAGRFDSTLVGHASMLAYNLRDEPDLGIGSDEGPRVPASEVVGRYQEAKRNDRTRPVFLNYTASFMNQSAGQRAAVKAYYETTSNAADILCFDIYPIFQRNRDDMLVWVADGVTELQAIAGHGKPVWAWIETSKGSRWISYDRQKDVTPEIVRSEVWMAIIRGATGIGYFTHAWRPEFNEFAPKPEVRAELARTNAQLRGLGPVILSAPAQADSAIAFENGLPGEVMTREYRGNIYVFANNLDMKDLGGRRDDVLTTYRSGRARISVNGLPAGAVVEVVDEERTIVADEGGFVDDFDPLAVHVYRIMATDVD